MRCKSIDDIEYYVDYVIDFTIRLMFIVGNQQENGMNRSAKVETNAKHEMDWIHRMSGIISCLIDVIADGTTSCKQTLL